ncbi:hypothetical protein Ppa06_41950 [Planomonospora parontospora subsp. parontospora]|uniref:Uncharacterized protein n=2 Tax=Planomonospora parontospora TaxID=58119 RepID=A0AA37BJ10_9ACTN|nr:hypothetical protein GCM10010126_41560 [Planomonospora parontospora]GII10397.1 hypothetical protein Ppa06_41950 [Planomonospora parontospora subsp. parontospora]
MGAVGLLLRDGLVPALARRDDRTFGTLVALVGKGDDAGPFQRAQDAPDTVGGQVMDLAGRAPEVQMILPSGEVITWMFMPWTRCLAEWYGRSAFTRSVRTSVPSSTR